MSEHGHGHAPARPSESPSKKVAARPSSVSANEEKRGASTRYTRSPMASSRRPSASLGSITASSSRMRPRLSGAVAASLRASSARWYASIAAERVSGAASSPER